MLLCAEETLKILQTSCFMPTKIQKLPEGMCFRPENCHRIVQNRQSKQSSIMYILRSIKLFGLYKMYIFLVEAIDNPAKVDVN